jgi:hypothetical protein
MILHDVVVARHRDDLIFLQSKCGPKFSKFFQCRTPRIIVPVVIELSDRFHQTFRVKNAVMPS